MVEMSRPKKAAVEPIFQNWQLKIRPDPIPPRVLACQTSGWSPTMSEGEFKLGRFICPHLDAQTSATYHTGTFE
jgi:hypothetical protein